MKRRAFTVLLLAGMLVTVGGCGEAEEAPKVTSSETTEAPPQPSAVDVSFENVNWDDLDFNKGVERLSTYTETDKKALASACAKGVSKATECNYEDAWDASIKVIDEMTAAAADLKSLLTLGSGTWSSDDKYRALILASTVETNMKEVNEYISISGTSVESEILNILNEQAEETEPEPEEERPNIEISWEDEALINSIKAFAEYDEKALSRVKDMYEKGLCIETGLAPEEFGTFVIDAVNQAKSDAKLVLDLLSIKSSWNESVEDSARKAAEDFVIFADAFKHYTNVAKEYEQRLIESTQTSVETATPEVTEAPAETTETTSNVTAAPETSATTVSPETSNGGSE